MFRILSLWLLCAHYSLERLYGVEAALLLRRWLVLLLWLFFFDAAVVAAVDVALLEPLIWSRAPDAAAC